MKRGNVAFDLFLDQLADAVAERVAKKLKPTTGAPVVVYTTNKSGPHLPGKTRRWMLDHIRLIPGAKKVGRDWEITAADWEAWKASGDMRLVRAADATPRHVRQATVTSVVDPADLQERARRSLQAAGFRRSRTDA